MDNKMSLKSKTAEKKKKNVKSGFEYHVTNFARCYAVSLTIFIRLL